VTAPTVELTGRDRDVVEFVRGYTAARGFPPSVREVGEAVGVSSTSTAAALIDKLIGVGALRRTPGVARSLVVVDGIVS
jgi:repressor LexA